MGRIAPRSSGWMFSGAQALLHPEASILYRLKDELSLPIHIGLLNMKREITDHSQTSSDPIKIHALDGPGPGGASTIYQVTFAPPSLKSPVNIPFQFGGIRETGVNGLTNEALLAIVVDRLRCFQQGKFACAENQQAMELAQQAIKVLHSRTAGRVARGVEGTHEV